MHTDQISDFDKKNLLEPGWAGEVSRAELSYIKGALKLSSSLRRRWGFRPSAKKLSDKRLRDVARNGL
jgi:hypothetical protein